MKAVRTLLARHGGPSPAPTRAHRPHARAAVLLEVLLALALFVVASAIVTASLNASLRSLDRQRLHLHAANLAASTLAEIQLGSRPPTPAPAQPLPTPLDAWSVEVAPHDTPPDFSGSEPLDHVQVIVRHRSEPIVQRLSLRLAPVAAPTLPGPEASLAP